MIKKCLVPASNDDRVGHQGVITVIKSLDVRLGDAVNRSQSSKASLTGLK